MHGPVPASFAPPPLRVNDIGLFLIALAVLVPGIGSEASISGQDEYYLSFRTVLEMRARGDWLVPWVNGEVRLQKPPVLYWAMLVSMEVFGCNTFAARLPSVLAGAALVMATARLARRCGGGAMLAGFLTLGCAGVAIEARRAMFDLPVACLATWSLVYGLDWWRRGSLAAMLAASALSAVASMTKGPVALWFVAAPALAGALVCRSRPAGRWWHLLPALALFSALALPWPLHVARTHPQFFQVLSEQAENRAFGLGNLQRLPAVFGALLGLCAPWSLLALGVMWKTLRGRSPASGTASWLLAWIGVGLVPFALMHSFERYVLALLAPLVVLMSLDLPAVPDSAQRRHLLIAAGIATVPILATAMLLLWFGLGILQAVVGLGASALLWRKLRTGQAAVQPAVAGVAVLWSVLLGWMYPAIGINRLPEELPAAVGTGRVATFGRPQPGMLSMRLERSVEHMAREPEGLPERLREFHGHLFVLEADRQLVLDAAAAAAVAPRESMRFGSFYSRKAWLRFVREGTTWADWRQALGERSPAPLQPRFLCLEFP
jgi:4-amino-4-deoxy-L-arabinose transferase-like glycosyltransferase